MLAAGGLVITSNYGGHLDFLNKNNSILIDGKLIRAPKNAQYWSSSVYASMFEPDINQAAEQLQYCVRNLEKLKLEKLSEIIQIKQIFNWNNVIDKIQNLCLV